MAKRRREQPAADAREIELKLCFAPDDLPLLQRADVLRQHTEGRVDTRLLRSVYFDTADLELRRAGIALRVRQDGSANVQTVKTRQESRAGLFERGEVECEVEGDLPDLAAIPKRALRRRLEGIVAGKTLEPVVRTEFRRTRRRVRRDGTELLCDLDIGEVVTPRGSTPIFELELELVHGDPSALFAVAIDLNESVPLRPSTLSKLGRGMAQLTGERPAAQKARPVSVPRRVTTEGVMEAVFDRCMEQILANEIPAHDGDDPEGIHQMRVGVRRLRSALSLFGSLLPREQLGPLAAELRWLGVELGGARDLDVFLLESFEPVFRSQSDDAALKRLRDEANELRTAMYERARAAIESPRYAALILRLGAWRASRAWRDQPLSEESASLFAPARRTSRELLAKRYRKARRLASDIERRSAQEKHALRIQLKKLRYASEFLCPLYPRKKAEPFIERLEGLQDVLGHLNDVATAERLLAALLERLGAERSPDHDHAAGFVAGWTAREALLRNAHLAEEWKAFKNVGAFWQA